LCFAGTIAFLVFSGWYNPGNVVLRTTKRTTIGAVPLQETRDEVVIQVARPVADWSAGDKITPAKADLARLAEADTWVIRGVSARATAAGFELPPLRGRRGWAASGRWRFGTRP